MWRHLVEPASILQAPTFCIHLDQANSHNDIRIPPNFNGLLMSTSALFKCQYTHRCVQRSLGLAAQIPVAFVGIVPVPSALAHISCPNIIVFQVTECYWTPCGNPPCSHILHTCQPSHFSKTHWLPTTYDDLLLSMPALFNCNYTSTCVQHLHKSYRICLHTFLLHLFKIAPVPFALAHISHVPTSQHSKRPHFMRTFCQNTLQASSMLPHFPHMSTKLFPTEVADSQHFELSVHEHACSLQLQLGCHMHFAPPQKCQGLVALLPVAFCWK